MPNTGGKSFLKKTGKTVCRILITVQCVLAALSFLISTVSARAQNDVKTLGGYLVKTTRRVHFSEEIARFEMKGRWISYQIYCRQADKQVILTVTPRSGSRWVLKQFAQYISYQHSNKKMASLPKVQKTKATKKQHHFQKYKKNKSALD